MDGGCQFIGVEGGDFRCEITNTAQDATFRVDKVWDIISTGGDLISQDATILVSCNNDFDGSSEVWGWFYDVFNLYGNESIIIEVDSSDELAICRAREIGIFDDAVEVDDSDCDQDHEIGPGGSASCTITNTVFFEGIPTLNQYGLALLALLMLGIGAVGFRRFG
jgi:hypothetical protein